MLDIENLSRNFIATAPISLPAKGGICSLRSHIPYRSPRGPYTKACPAPLTTAFVYSGLASKLAPGINKKRPAQKV